MTLANRLTRMPRAHDPAHGADAAACVPWAEGPIRDLITGAGGSSPYLKGLLAREGDWLQGAVDEPEAALKTLCTLADPAAYPAADPAADPAVDLRIAKRRIALLTALADLGGAWSLEQVTGALSDFADAACQAALVAALRREIKRGKLPGMTEDDAAAGAGMVVLAMGKMGARELNYSSDIDLICLFDESRFDRDDFHTARSSLVRATRNMAATLSQITGEGYVFRTDLRLRPDPSVTPVCMSMAAAEAYYESLGRTWERAAYIKARPCAGDLKAGQRFLRTLRPFVWRRHLDFTAIEDAHAMRLAIREHKGLGGPITLPCHDMKLGRGGIREIEFFTQTRQIIAGGRDRDLRVRGTVAGLAVLARKGWIAEDVSRTLTDHYRFHREIEHRMQMIRDAQTHALPRSDAGFDRLAALCGADVGDLKRDLAVRLAAVHTLTEDFFAPDNGTGDAPAQDAPEWAGELAAGWSRYAALRSARALEIFERLKPDILARLAKTAQPKDALRAFDGFLAGLPAGVQLFALFEANPQLIDLLVDITGTAPALAQHLSRNANVFDAVIGGDFFAPWPGATTLSVELTQLLEAETDYEARLDAARRWGKEWHFRIGVHLLRDLVTTDEAGAQYADLACAMLQGLWPVVVDHFALKYGAPPGRGALVLAMGSLGAGLLNAKSDLDLIVIYDPADVEASDGRRSLPSRSYYARLTQAMVTAMTAPMAEGRLYEIDMRLRPSGHQGPVATSWAAFQAYQTQDAWVWEHLALTRARATAGSEALALDVEVFRQSLLGTRDASEVFREVASMRDRIAAAKAPEGPWDAKIGRGRMQDIELIAATGALIAGEPGRDVAAGLDAGVAIGLWNDAARATLVRAYAITSAVHLAGRLLAPGVLDPAAVGEGGCALLLRVTGMADLATLDAEWQARIQAATDVIDAILEETTG